MSNYLLLCFRTFVFATLVFFPLSTKAQVFIGEPVPVDPPQSVKKVLTKWEVYRLNSDAMKQVANSASESANFQLQLGQHNWALQLEPSRILAPDYFVQVSTDKGIEKIKRTDHRAFRGYEVSGGGRVRLTLDKDFIHGFIEVGSERYYLEPYWYHQPDAPRDLVLFYTVSDVIHDQEATCIELASEEELPKYEKLIEEKANTPESQACYELDIAIASDKSMFNKYGSVVAVENHNIAVINDVQGDYTGSFTHDLEFVIVTQFVVTGTDPWTNSTNPNTLLGSFRTWGQNGGFGVTFDNGELWTNRDFDGVTVGIAYINGICTSTKYHCLQDYTGNAEQLRCLTSHEIGHNFTAQHDPQAPGSCPPNFIMCPFVSTTSTWSSTSISQISSYMQTKIGNCLTPCASGPPLVSDFDWSPNPGCEDEPVQFTDLSTGNITGRTWTFTGGTPPTSTATNPLVTWANPGTYNVTLTLTGAGGPVSATKSVVINADPVSNFTYTYDGLTYFFTSTSTNASTYAWDFGDGAGFSNEQNPVYTYQESGIYQVRLTVENDCGSSTKAVFLNTVPTAGFSASPTSGCKPLTVSYSNQSSSNATAYSWQFPGGIPSTANIPNPVVVYANSGSFSATLTVSNGAGNSTLTQTNLITVQNVPTSNFVFSINNLTVTFTNASTGGGTYSWNFGDGNTSTLANPIHTYSIGGVYNVTLTATNDCGADTITKTVTLLAPPTASFLANVTSGCDSLTVQFTSTTTGNPTSYNWSFPGGTPSSSTSPNPTVFYGTPGIYDVTLIAGNAAGNDTLTLEDYITINDTPNAGFTSSADSLTVTFVNTSQYSTTYSWNFGDGGTSTATSPVHTYAGDGVYTVTLIANGPCGADTLSQTVTIVTPPLAGFTATPTSGCGPLSVQFTNTSSANATTYSWSFPGGMPGTSSQQNPVVVYAVPGTYSVTLTASNSAGSNTFSQSGYITVNPDPAAGFSSSADSLTVTFTNTSANATSYNWNFGDGNTSTSQNPVHSYAADGTYTVTLIATGPCGNDTTSQTITLVTPPTAGFTLSPTSGCGPLTVQFTSTSSANATNFSWSFPGGTPGSSTSPNPTVVYTAPGTYSATLTVSNSAGSSTATQTNVVTVNPGPTAGFSSSVNGNVANFTNSSQNAVSYTWNFGDGGNSTQQNPAHTYANDGTYTVTLLATNPCGTDTFTQTVTIATPPTAAFTASPTSGCGPLTVQFTNNSSANSVNFNWSFPGGTPSSSTAQNPVVTYNVPGTYTVTLTVSNSVGSNTATQTSFITVQPGPTAGFSSTTDSLTATFTNSSSNSTSYSWNFGDGNSSNNSNPVHTYAEDGTYTVVLTATNPCGTSTYTQNVVIITSPTAGFTANTTTGCGPLTVEFEDLSSGNTTAWEWSFPGGMPSTSTQQNPVIVYSTPGTYTVTLVASNPAGTNTFTQNGFITVLPVPTAGFNSSGTGPTIAFINGSQNASTYVWDFGDGSTSNQPNPSHTYNADGTYTVMLIATNNCGSDTFTQTVNVLLPPATGFTPSVTEGCAPLEVSFTNQSSATATSFNWTFEGGTPANSTASNPTVIFNQPGVYTVTLVASNASGSNTATATVTVLGPPTANFTHQTAGLAVVLSNTSTNATGYLWNFGDGNTSTENSPSHTYATTGTYTVTLQAWNACDTVTTSQTVEIVGTAPIAAFTANLQEGCVPLSVQFKDQSAGNPTGWSWTFPGGSPDASTEPNPTVTYNAPGSYAVTLEVTNPFGSGNVTLTDYIVVAPLPSASFNYDVNVNTVTFNNLSLNGNMYSWNFGDGATSTEQNPTHTYTLPGTYTVELTVSNNCGASTLQQMIMLVFTGTGDVAWVERFRLYPNPTTGIVTVEMEGDARNELEFTLFNSLGQLVRRETANFHTGILKQNFDYGTQPAGVYTLQIRSGSKTFRVKLVIQR